MEGLLEMKRAVALQLLVSSAVLFGCGPGHVEGSLSVLMDLRYQKVMLQTSADEVGVSFIEPRGTGEDTSLQITVRLEGIQLFPNIAFDLAEVLDDGSLRGSVSRDVLNDPHRTFPPIREGRFHLLEVPGATGSSVSGDFHLIFDNCTDFACGYTAFANFTGQVP